MSRAHAARARRPRRPASASGRRVLEIEVVWADLSRAEGDLFVVGHYQGVLPQNAELALDRALSGTDDPRRLALTDLARRGVIRGALGDVVFFPWRRGKTVALAGMGRPGTFQADQLRLLSRSLLATVGRLAEPLVVCTVLIGSGEGNLGIGQSVDGLLRGLGEALAGDVRLRVPRIRIVERSLERALATLQELKARTRSAEARTLADWRVSARLAEEPGGIIDEAFGYSMVLAAVAQGSGLPEGSPVRRAIQGLLRKLPAGELRRQVEHGLKRASRRSRALRSLALQFRLAPARAQETSGPPMAMRISFCVEGDAVSSAAITHAVTVSERKLGASLLSIHRAVERLQAVPPDRAEAFGRGLARRLVHADFVPFFADPGPLVVEVDRAMASVQWEMLVTDDDGTGPLGVRRAVARQIRTTYSPRPADIAARPAARALVIGDPGDPARGLALPHAREEAIAVWQWMARRGIQVTALIGPPGPTTGPPTPAGARPADLAEAIDLLLAGEFDIVHYCGHAEWSSAYPSLRGWVFKDGFLSAGDLEGMERPPRLVVANACESGQLAQSALSPLAIATVATVPGVPEPPEGPEVRRGDVGLVALLADEFFRRGIVDYIGTAWDVPSLPATRFAQVFYQAVLPSRASRGTVTLGEAVQRARQALYDNRKRYGDQGSVWGAYQHYGDPTNTL